MGRKPKGGVLRGVMELLAGAGNESEATMEDMEMSDEEKEGREILEEMGLPEKACSIRVFKTGPTVWEGRKCLGVHGKSIKSYDDAAPRFEDLRDELAIEYGGGDYSVRVQDAKGRWLDGGTRRFHISTDEFPPKAEDDRAEEEGAMTPPWRRHRERAGAGLPTMPTGAESGLSQALITAVMSSTQSIVQGMQHSAEQNQAALRLMMEQSREDRRAREEQEREDRRARGDQEAKNTQVILDSMTKVVDVAGQSQRNVVEVLQGSKGELTELLKTMAVESKQNATSMMGMFMQALMQGMELGTRVHQPPRSEMAEILSSFSGAFEKVIEAGALQPPAGQSVDRTVLKTLVDDIVAQEVGKRLPGVVETATPQEEPEVGPPTARPIRPQQPPEPIEPSSTAQPQPEGGKETDAGATEMTAEEVERSLADTALRFLIKALDDRPEDPRLMSTVASLVPKPVVEEALRAKDVQPVFNWLETNGSPDLVDALHQRLSSEESKQWFRQVIEKEAGAQAT